MGKKQLIKNLITNIIAFSSSLLISFILTPYLISTTGKEAYAFFPIANNFVSYFSIITLALNSMASRFITIEIVKKNNNKAQIYYSSVFYANVVLVLILSLPLTLITIFLESLLNIPPDIIYDVKILFSMIFLTMIISVITSVFGVATFAKNRIDLRSSGEIILGLIKLLLYFALITFFKPSIVFVGIVSLLLSLVNFIIQVVFTRILIPEFNISTKSFNFSAVKELFVSGVWNSINSLGAVLMLGISLLIANVFINPSASGELSIVQTLPNFISGIISMLFSIFLPRITHIFAMNDKTALINEVTLSQKIIGLLATTPALLVILFGSEFFNLWVPLENSVNLQTLSIITIAPLIIHANMWSIYGLIIVLNKVKVPSVLLITVGIVNLLSCSLTLKYVANDIHVIPLISSFLNILYYMFFIPIYASYQMKISKLTFLGNIMKSVIYGSIFITFGFTFKSIIHISNWFQMFSWGALFGICGLLIHILLLFSLRDLKQVFNLIKGSTIKRDNIT